MPEEPTISEAHGKRSPHGGRQFCVAKAKSTGLRCTKYAIPGGTVCRIHGGASPQVKRKAEERWAELEGTSLELAIIQAKHELAGIQKANGKLTSADIERLRLKFRDLVDAADKACKIGELLAGRATDRTHIEIGEAQQLVAVILSGVSVFIATNKREDFLAWLDEVKPQLTIEAIAE